MKEKKNSGVPVDEIVADLIEKNGWEKQLEMYSLFSRWEELVSKELHEHCRPVRINRDILWLEVDNSAWMAQLGYQKYAILDTLNSVLRLGCIREIKMALSKKEAEFSPVKSRSGPRVVYEPPPVEEIARFRKKIHGVIKDDACREGLEEFWYLAQACHRLDEE